MSGANRDPRIHATKESSVELQTAAVSYRVAELRQLARSLRLERRARRLAPAHRLTTLRLALGRRLVALGGALLEGEARPHAHPR
jgi:hypothetical protein